GETTASLVLYNPRPAGLTKVDVISPPREPIAPPMACCRAVPLGTNQDNRNASSGTCEIETTEMKREKMRNKYFIIKWLPLDCAIYKKGGKIFLLKIISSFRKKI